jgi:hypothetical protein
MGDMSALSALRARRKETFRICPCRHANVRLLREDSELSDFGVGFRLVLEDSELSALGVAIYFGRGDLLCPILGERKTDISLLAWLTQSGQNASSRETMI